MCVCLQGKGKASAVDKGKSAASGKGKGTVQEEAATASDRSNTNPDHLTGLCDFIWSQKSLSCLVLVEAYLPHFTLLLLAHSKHDHTMPLQHALVFEVLGNNLMIMSAGSTKSWLLDSSALVALLWLQGICRG